MDKILGNFLTQGNMDFPLDCETLDYLQALAGMSAIVGNIAGDKVVLLGCTPNEAGTQRREGYVFLRTAAAPEGEVLRWAGGSVTSGMYVEQEAISVNANNCDYAQAYTRRYLAPGIGSENYRWEDFQDLSTVRKLMEDNADVRSKLDGLQGAPIGVVYMWAGQILPEGYLICDGKAYAEKDYPELAKTLGHVYNSALDYNDNKPVTTMEGQFRVPDLRGRFVVGWNDMDNDYRKQGNTGGKKSVRLKEAQMPRHSHVFKDYYYPESHDVDYSESLGGHNKGGGSGKTDYDNTNVFYKEHSTQAAGQGESVDLRPPYYVLTYIIKAK